MEKVDKVYKKIQIDKLVPSYWNTNKMSEDEFNRLAQEIDDVGFISPLEVVPVDGEEERYEIIGGEHRWEACKVLGYKEVDCIVLTGEKWKDEDLRKFVSVRLNIIKGKMDPEKFTALYEEMEKKYGADSLKDLMGFTDEAAWNKLTGGIREALSGTGLSKETIDKFDESMKEIKTVDGLSSVLNNIFNEHGDTLQYNFISFNYGGKEGLFVLCEDGGLYSAAKSLIDKAKENKVTADRAFGKFLKGWEKEGIDDLEANVNEEPKSDGADY